MAAIETTRVAPFGAITAFRFVEFVERAVKTVKAKFVADNTYHELAKLTPAQLRDIGLADQDLDAYCRQVARRAL